MCNRQIEAVIHQIFGSQASVGLPAAGSGRQRLDQRPGVTRQDWEPIASLGVIDGAAWRAVQIGRLSTSRGCRRSLRGARRRRTIGGRTFGNGQTPAFIMENNAANFHQCLL